MHRHIHRALVIAKLTLTVSIVFFSARSLYAQWWNPFAPRDYEECAESAAKEAKTNAALNVLIDTCDAKFKGRRKLGGGYTYYDVRQNRSFDIAGPNPTSGEIKYIDDQYSLFLDEQQKAAAARAEEAFRLQQAEAAARAEEALRLQQADAEIERKRRATLNLVRVVSTGINCSLNYQGCGAYEFTIRLQNKSEENISAISLGWAFLSTRDTTCPSALPTKQNERVTLRPGDSMVFNLQGYDGPSGPEKIRYCVSVTDVKIGR